MIRRLAVLGAVLIGAATLMSCAPEWTPSAHPTGAEHYVSFGDSWVSGPLIANQVGDPIDCGRSDHNFASLLAQHLDVAAFTDMSCGGADIGDLWKPHKANLGGKAPAQFDALRSDTTLVTIGMGGNDASIADSSIKCVNILPIPLGPPPFGKPCVDGFTSGGVDKIAAKIAKVRPKMDDALAEIHRRSPHAEVYVIGYGAAFPDTGDGCWPYVPLLPPDVRYLRAKMQELNVVLAQSAADAGAHFVDVWSLTRGHDLCQPYGTAWVNGVALDPPGFPAHANAFYHEHLADYLAGLVRSDEGVSPS
ncbi:MAG: SGNH/GDSL hydrolase family protein [Acidimicrobiales bacterium]